METAHCFSQGSIQQRNSVCSNLATNSKYTGVNLSDENVKTTCASDGLRCVNSRFTLFCRDGMHLKL